MFEPEFEKFEPRVQPWVPMLCFPPPDVRTLGSNIPPKAYAHLHQTFHHWD